MREKQFECFIAAAPDVDVRHIREALLGRGVRVSDPTARTGGASDHAALIDTLARATLVLGVLSPTMAGSVAFAVGAAAGFHKSVLLLVPPEVAEIPLELRGFASAHVALDDRAAIDAALAPLLAIRRGPSGGRPAPTPEAAQDDAADLRAGVARAARNGDGPELERLMAQLLREHGEGITLEVPPVERRIDLIAWSEQLQSSVGSPFPIEIKKRFPAREHVVRALEQFDTAIASVGARAGMLIYGVAPELDDAVWRSHPHVLSISVEALLSRLDRENLVEILQAWHARRDPALAEPTRN